jgi:hypothetical protein
MLARRKEARTCGRDGASPEKSSPKIALDKKTRCIWILWNQAKYRFLTTDWSAP